MVELSLKVINTNGEILAENRAQDEVMLVYKSEYSEGDRIVLSTSKKNTYLVVQMDDALGKAFIYVTKDEITYNIPFGEKKISYSPKSFHGNLHLMTARVATREEIDSYKNLTLNIYDQHGDTGYFPHAVANVETRGESVFAARNAIDGICENHSHGAWPYQSWGINRQDDAEIKVYFGRQVIADKLVLYTRADFPHDNWWEKVTVTFSDGSQIIWNLKKSDKPHILELDNIKTEWIMLSELIKADDPSPFPALTQIEVYGFEG